MKVVVRSRCCSRENAARQTCKLETHEEREREREREGERERETGRGGRGGKMHAAAIASPGSKETSLDLFVSSELITWLPKTNYTPKGVSTAPA